MPAWPVVQDPFNLKKIASLEAENTRLRGALGFYANDGNYVPAGIGPTIWKDNGMRAREALTQSTGENHD